MLTSWVFFCLFASNQINNTAVGHAIILPTSGSQLNDTIRRLLTCHVCLGKASKFPSRLCQILLVAQQLVVSGTEGKPS